ncbi:hypothetical protein Snoj_36300 [Streptomyces nojiriensis]|uniref:Integral membrane protein n=1 Tax=Streptomyces nojiriensis TaxID=66374 RepID=A0ABQ3SNT9_9ACTN|nr:hypothetical protein [Streptomyces nojiriensis]QTI43267.1 hypothetical protein JYK04_01029 [Streptomyces nojiriensis]GGS11750.1 hypothetical protein GCM10010205_46670 [Streptomyces nojiriensis]GHI69712.1 hypothetical protein Snoj_36300 [Streptomyces nojiriensis]
MGFRYAVGGFGLAVMAFGGFLLVREPEPWRIALWLAGGVLVHDGLIAPLVIAVGALCAAAGLRLRGVPRAALVVAGCLTVIALPPLLRPGGVANASVLPLDYPRNWLLAMASIGVLAYAGARAWARARTRRRRAALRR